MRITKGDTFTSKIDKYSTYTYTGKTIKGRNYTQPDISYIFVVNNSFAPVMVSRTESQIKEYFEPL